MSEKRRGLGRGLGALIPTAPQTRSAGDRPVDVFFPEKAEAEGEGAPAADGQDAVSTPSTVVPVPPPSAATPAPAVARQAVPPVGGGTLGRGIGALSGGLRTDSPPSTSPLAPTAPSATPAPSAPPARPAPVTAPAATAPAVTGHTAPVAATTGLTSGATNGTTTGSTTQAPAISETELVPVPGARFAELPVKAISPNPRQPRTVFDEEALAELVHSVKEVGVLQPVVVRQTGDDTYELIMGERRWRAVQEAGFATVPAIIRDTTDDNLLRDALLENLHRSQLNPLEEAAAYQQLLDDFGCTHEELAARIGRSRPQISNTLRLMKLPPLVQRRVAAGVLSAGHARALLGLEDSASMEALAARIVSEGLSVRAVEEIVALGDGPVVKPQKKRPRPGAHHSELDSLASRLGDKLDTRVSVALGRSKGKLSIEFASVEDLNRIIGLMSPDLRGVFKEN